jgi:zinc protease
MDKIDRSIKPLPEKEIIFALPEMQKFSLDNKLEVFFVQKNALPILQLNMVVNGGSKFDPDNKKGLANLTSMLIDEGAGNYNALELSDEFETLGSHFNIGTTQDNIFLSLQTLKENFQKSLDLFSTVITKPHLNQNDFEREKRKVLIRILQLKDEPDQIADLVFEHLIFNYNPYSFPLLGDEKNVNNISVEDAKKFYNVHFNPSDSALIIVGDSNRDELKENLNHFFAQWKRGNGSKIPIDKPSADKTQVYLVHKDGAVQSEIRIGHLSSKRNEEDFYSRTLLNNILGGQFSSRINLNLREDKGYTYGASSRFVYYKDSAYFLVSTSVGAENTGNSVKEIMNELSSIRSGATQKELDFSKSSTIRRFPSNFETNKQIASNLAVKYIFSLPDNYFNNYIQNLKKVDLEDVNRAAVKNIFPEESAILIVGDKNKITEQLEKLNLSEVKLINYPVDN